MVTSAWGSSKVFFIGREGDSRGQGMIMVGVGVVAGNKVKQNSFASFDFFNMHFNYFHNIG